MSARIIQIPTQKNNLYQVTKAIELIESRNERLRQMRMAETAISMGASPRCPCGCWDDLMQNGGMV